jgi:hypothetical protein
LTWFADAVETVPTESAIARAAMLNFFLFIALPHF